MGYNPKTGEFTTETKIFPSLAMQYGTGGGTAPESGLEGLGGMLGLAAGASGVAALGQIGLGIYQSINARRLKKQFEAQEKASYMKAAGQINENKRLYEQQMRQGLSPEARNIYENQMASDAARGMRAAQELSGGQSSSALSRMFSLDRIKGAQNLALMDQQARERALVGVASTNRELASLEQMDQRRKMQQEDMTMQQIAGLGQDARQNIFGAIGAVPTGLSNLAYIQALTQKDQTA